MSTLQNVKLSYDAIQDRLLLVFITSDFMELRFWITRSFSKKLIEALKNLQNTLIKSPLEQKVEMEKAAQSVQPEPIQPEASKYGFKLSKDPIGNEPLLMLQAKINIVKENEINFVFVGPNNSSVSLNFHPEFVPTFLQLFEKTIAQTDWNIRYE